MKLDQLRQFMQAIAEAAINDKEETSKAISEMMDKPDGSVPLVIRMLKRRPDICTSALIKGTSLYNNKEILDPKTSELIAISSAVANRCEFCLSVHMDKALSHGATEEEIFHAILISSAICESSAWAIAFREFRKLEGKEARKRKKSA